MFTTIKFYWDENLNSYTNLKSSELNVFQNKLLFS